MRIALVSTAVPRRCGIATYSADLAGALRTADQRAISRIAAIDEKNVLRAYATDVRWRIQQGSEDSYIKAAEAINKSNAEAVIVQHEFALFGQWHQREGGRLEYEDHLTPMLRELHKPVVTTFHSVPKDPSPSMRRAIYDVSSLSDRVVVMSDTTVPVLRDEYEITAEPVVIHHGVPVVEPRGRSRLKARLGLEGRSIILTFGLVGPGKGIEYVIKAMPEILAQHPNALYLIAGQTHPDVLRREGESYRVHLTQMVDDLGLENHVTFLDQYLSNRDVIECLLLADIYVSCNQDPNQITSGTLSYAMGAGKAIIATKYPHAREALSDDRGLLVDFADSDSIAVAANKILGDPGLKTALEMRAHELGKEMTWPNAGHRTLAVLHEAIAAGRKPRAERRRSDRPTNINLGKRVSPLPIITPPDVKPSADGLEVVCVFNPGAIKVGDETLLLLRVAERPRTDVEIPQDAKTIDFESTDLRLKPLPPGLSTDDVIATLFLDVHAEPSQLAVVFVPRDLPGLDLSDPRGIRYRAAAGGFGFARSEFTEVLTQMSHLRLARSTDGVNFAIDNEPAMVGSSELEEFGIEDAHITQIGDTYYVTYVSVSTMGMATALATTKDFKSFDRHGIMFLPDNKDVCIFPGKVHGKYVALTRPMPPSFGHIHGIWIAYSDDLRQWGPHKPLAMPRTGMWDELRTGASTVPFLTEQGWLEIYHGVDGNSRYCLGALLLDRDDPSVVLARSDRPLFVPTEPWERAGLFNEAVFSCGHVPLDPAGESIRVYYGAADSCTGAVDFKVKEILEQMTRC